MAFAETKSSRNSLRDQSSAQYQAVEWLAQDKVDNGSNWSGYELVQRYVFRILYHSTRGENWNSGCCSFDADTTWFGASSVCDWGSSNAQCNGNGQQVDHIYLRDDNLQGSIPDELGQLTALTYLVLSNNQMTGTIPSQLGELTSLTLLSLRSNQLTGTIPLAFAQLTNLGHLILYINNLTGQMPSGVCAAPFPDWRADGQYENRLWVDCISEVQCDCCDRCYDENDNLFCRNGIEFTSNANDC